MFMIVLLPVLLYPALGLGLTQVLFHVSQSDRTIGIVGLGNLPSSPPLLREDRGAFHPDLWSPSLGMRACHVIELEKFDPADILSRRVQAVLVVPPDARDRLAEGAQIEPEVFYNGADDNSALAYHEVVDLFHRYRAQLVTERMKSIGRPANFADPLRVRGSDLSTAQQRGGTYWSKAFPFLLVMMALTGAFYPAIDLCAGEKERGTMETLLITPTTRGEIVLGKFLTVFTFSVATTVFNLASMGITFERVSALLRNNLPQADALFAPPSFLSVVWMLVLMLPLAGFFSALSMALAIFARSSKEGQYYLVPLFLVVLPLILLTLAPGVEISPFFSLVPVTNVALLLRTLMLNDYEKALVYLLPVMAPTMLYGYMALRAAVEQFHREDVLFREAEPFNFRLWLAHLLRAKEPTPTSAEAWVCFILMLLFNWYLQGMLPPSLSSVVVTQLVVIAFPPLLLAVMLTSSVSRSLSLRRPAWKPTLLALALVLAIHPLAVGWGERLKDWLPPTEALEQALEQLVAGSTLFERLLVMAVLPAVCEEIAFRGFLLSGFLRKHPPWRAILMSGVLFGAFHMIPQQMISASVLGVLLGLVATRTGSLFPGIVFHGLHNSLIIGMEGFGLPTHYGPLALVASGSLAVMLVGALSWLPPRLPERRLRPR